MNNIIICPKCEEKNYTNYLSCFKCGSHLKEEDFYLYNDETFNKLFSLDNKKKLEETRLSVDVYDLIINNIMEIGSVNIYNIPPTVDYDSLSNFTRLFIHLVDTDTITYTNFNSIHLDKNLKDSIKLNLLLNEFSNYLTYEIYKQTIIELLNINETLVLEYFAWYLTVCDDYLKILTEYVGKKIEEYFLPESFSGYESLNNYIKENIDFDKLRNVLSFADAVADDIIFIMENFIIRDYSNLTTKRNYEILNEDIKTMSFENKRKTLDKIISEKFNIVYENKDEMFDVLCKEKKIRY